MHIIEHLRVQIHLTSCIFAALLANSNDTPNHYRIIKFTSTVKQEIISE